MRINPTIKITLWVSILSLLFIPPAYWLLFTTFKIYDDEGYILIALKHFSDNGRLYNDVYSQYGPFPFLLYDGLHRIFSLPYTNTTGRLITLVHWLICASGCSWLVARVTRSFALALFTYVATFVYLWPMINEPIHPGGLIASILTVACVSAFESWQDSAFRAFVAITGTTTAILFLTKINVGVLFAGSTFIWFAIHAEPVRLRRLAIWGGMILVSAIPYLLMRSLLSQTWVMHFGVIFSSSALAVIVTAGDSSIPTGKSCQYFQYLGWAIATGTIICTLALLHGTSVHALIEGVITSPLAHPGKYSFAVKWRPFSLVLALAIVTGVSVSKYLKITRSQNLVMAIAWLRLAILLVFAAVSLELLPISIAGFGISYGIPLAAIFVIPLSENRMRDTATGWLALLLVFQALHAYPVAGSQLNWGTFFFVPLLALGTHDATELLSATHSTQKKIKTATLIVLYTCAAGMALIIGKIGWSRFSTSQKLGIPCAEDLRLPDDTTEALRIIVHNCSKHGDMLFSFPGMFSLNLWTRICPPTYANATHWFSLLSGKQQQQIIDKLTNSSAPILVTQRELLDYQRDNNIIASGPLYDWIAHHFAPAMSIDGYEIWTRDGRTIAPISTGHVESVSPSKGDSLVLTLEGPNLEVSSIDICEVNHQQNPVASLSGNSIGVYLSSCTYANRDTSPYEQKALPLKVDALHHIRLLLPLHLTLDDWKRTLLILKDSKGHVAGKVRIIEPINVGVPQEEH